jgi:hypothetical protein
MIGTPSVQAVVSHEIGGRPRRAPSSMMVETPVKLDWIVAVVPTRIGTSSCTLMRTRTNSGSLSHSTIWLTWPTGTPAKLTCEPLVSPDTDCLKKMSYSFRSPCPRRASQMMKAASIASSTSVTAPTQTWLALVSMARAMPPRRRNCPML